MARQLHFPVDLGTVDAVEVLTLVPCSVKSDIRISTPERAMGQVRLPCCSNLPPAPNLHFAAGRRASVPKLAGSSVFCG